MLKNKHLFISVGYLFVEEDGNGAVIILVVIVLTNGQLQVV